VLANFVRIGIWDVCDGGGGGWIFWFLHLLELFFAKVRLIIEYLCVDRRVLLWSFPSAQYHVTSVITALNVLTTEVDVSGVRQHRWAFAFFATLIVNLKRLIYFSNTEFLLKIWCSGGLLLTADLLLSLVRSGDFLNQMSEYKLIKKLMKFVSIKHCCYDNENFIVSLCILIHWMLRTD